MKMSNEAVPYTQPIWRTFQATVSDDAPYGLISIRSDSGVVFFNSNGIFNKFGENIKKGAALDILYPTASVNSKDKNKSR